MTSYKFHSSTNILPEMSYNVKYMFFRLSMDAFVLWFMDFKIIYVHIIPSKPPLRRVEGGGGIKMPDV
jgi:hypothetical protein